MKKLFFNLLMVSLICLASSQAGCSKKDAESPSKKTKLAFVTNGTTDFWVFTRKGCEKAEAELKDFEVDFRLVSD
ncbi:MAG: hypothetical protein WAK60_06495, partial [Sedimentisphaerales bacterium]